MGKKMGIENVLNSRKNFVYAGLVLAVLSIISANLTWFSVSAPNVLGTTVQVTASGQAISPGLTAAGLVAIASALFLAISGRVGRYVALTLSFLSAALLATATLISLNSPVGSLATIFAEATGTDAVPDAVSVTPWPIALLLFAALLVLTSITGMFVCRRWENKKSKYERTSSTETDIPADGRPSGELVTDERQMWDSLSEGIDPTAK